MKLKTISHRFSFLMGIVFCSQIGFAQHSYFVESGKIEFEKKVNMYAKLKNRVSENNTFMQKIYDEYRKTQPQFITSKSSLSFSPEKSIYVFLEEEKQGMTLFGNEPWLMAKNTIHHSFKTDSVTAIKNVYDDNFVIKDKKP